MSHEAIAIRYAVVRTHGCYGQSETVYAARVSDTLDAAERYAASRTRAHRSAMARYGGTSGGYRVVEVAPDATRTSLSWRGIDLDSIPDA